MKSIKLNYYYDSKIAQFSFYRVPKALMTNPNLKNLSNDAKILYSLMCDRMNLSMKNNWVDENNRVYIFFTLADVQKNLNCCHTKGIKILAELDTENGVGLIERIKQGQGKPTRIYIKNFMKPVDNSVDNPVDKSEICR